MIGDPVRDPEPNPCCGGLNSYHYPDCHEPEEAVIRERNEEIHRLRAALMAAGVPEPLVDLIQKGED